MKLPTPQNKEAWFIVFHDGSSREITVEQAQQIFKLSSQPNQQGVKIGESYYRFSTFAKVLPAKEYYVEYPDKRPPVETAKRVKMLPDDIQRILSPIKQPEKRLRALQEMRKGLLKYINSPDYQGTNKPLKLLEKIEYKIKTIEKNVAE